MWRRSAVHLYVIELLYLLTLESEKGKMVFTFSQIFMSQFTLWKWKDHFKENNFNLTW